MSTTNTAPALPAGQVQSIVRQVLAEHTGEIGRLKAAVEAGARAALAQQQQPASDVMPFVLRYGRYCRDGYTHDADAELISIRLALDGVQQPAASGAQRGERAAFEDWAIRAGSAFRDEKHGIYSPAGGLAHAWEAWQARAALAAAPAAAPFGYMDQRTLDSMSKLSPRGYVMPVITRSAFDDCTVPVYAGAAPAAARPDTLAWLERPGIAWSANTLDGGGVALQWMTGGRIQHAHGATLGEAVINASGAAAPAGEQQPLTDKPFRWLVTGGDCSESVYKSGQVADGVAKAMDDGSRVIALYASPQDTKGA